MKFAKEVGTAFWGNFSDLQQLLCKRHVDIIVLRLIYISISRRKLFDSPQ